MAQPKAHGFSHWDEGLWLYFRRSSATVYRKSEECIERWRILIMTYTLTFRLKTEKWQEDKLNKRLEIGRNIYNACLREILKRYNTMINSEEYKQILS